MRKVIRITSKIEGFRRCGVAHSKSPVDHPYDRFTTAEIDTLRADPNLTIAIADAPAAPDPAERREAIVAALTKSVVDRDGVPFTTGAEALAAASAVFGAPLSAEDVLDAVMTAPRPTPAEPAAAIATDTRGGTPDAAKEPELTEAELRAQTIRNAADALDAGNKKHFTRDGKPEVKAIEDIVGKGFNTTRAEIDAALAAK